MKKKLPEFKNEDDERKFWATADSTEYIDWPSGKRRKLVHAWNGNASRDNAKSRERA